MKPEDSAAAILNHYFAHMARLVGMRWDASNRADIERAAQLLAMASAEDDAGDTIPAYVEPAPRVTQVFDREEINDPEFIAWRAERRAVVRMMDRNYKEGAR